MVLALSRKPLSAKHQEGGGLPKHLFPSFSWEL